jgi:hypothetical protein
VSNNNKIVLEKKINKSIVENNNEKNISKECILKPCFTNIIKGIFEILKEIVSGELRMKSYSNIAHQYIKYNKIDVTINNKRICKTPFKKWYIKGYTNKSDSIKIVNFILGFTKEKLNKNLMIKVKNSMINKINYVN